MLETWTGRRGVEAIIHLQALLYEVVAEPLNHHVALPGGHGLVVDADHQRLPGLLHGYASRSLENQTRKGKDTCDQERDRSTEI